MPVDTSLFAKPGEDFKAYEARVGKLNKSTPPFGDTSAVKPNIPPRGTTSDFSFLSILNNMRIGLQQNNALVDQKNLIQKHLFDQPLTPDEMLKLPPDVRHIVQSGDQNNMRLQLQIINDSLQGRNQSIASSIQFLTTGYEQAQTRYNQDVQNVLKYAEALRAKPSDVMRALYPAEADRLGTALDNLAIPSASATKWQRIGTDENGNPIYGYPPLSPGLGGTGTIIPSTPSSLSPSTLSPSLPDPKTAEQWFRKNFGAGKETTATPPDPSFANVGIPEIGYRTPNDVWQFALGVAFKDDKVQAAVGGLSTSSKTASGRADIAFKRMVTNAAGAIGAALGGLPKLQLLYKAKTPAATKFITQALFVKNYLATATDNLNLALDQSQKVGRTDAKFVNNYIQWAQRNFTPAGPLAQFETYIYTASREYAKVTSGGAMSAQGLTDSAQREASKLLNAAQSPEAFASVVEAMKQDMANVVKELDKTVGGFSQSLGLPTDITTTDTTTTDTNSTFDNLFNKYGGK